jgi:predicted NACHT family NTPase
VDKDALLLINCTLFNSFLVYKNLNPGSKLKYKGFLVQVVKAWATDEILAAQTQSQTQCDLTHQLMRKPWVTFR